MLDGLWIWATDFFYFIKNLCEKLLVSTAIYKEELYKQPGIEDERNCCEDSKMWLRKKYIVGIERNI